MIPLTVASFTLAEASCSSHADGSCSPAEQPGGTWSLPQFQLPGFARTATSQRPLVIGASPGTTATMSLYYALKALDVSTVHYSRHFNATTGRESTSYPQGGGPVPLLKPIFQDSQPAPPVDLAAVRKLDLRFLGEHTDALLDTPAQVCSRGLLFALQPYVCEAATHACRPQPMHAGCYPMHRRRSSSTSSPPSRVRASC